MAIYNLEDRTLDFAKRVRNFVKQIPKNLITIEIAKQLIRSSGSVGANYIEANEAVSKKDFAFRIKITRKEAKESRYWLNLIDAYSNLDLENERLALIDEATQLLKIFSSIIVKSASHD